MNVKMAAKNKGIRDNREIQRLMGKLAKAVVSERNKVIYKIWKSGHFRTYRELGDAADLSKQMVFNIVKELDEQEAEG